MAWTEADKQAMDDAAIDAQNGLTDEDAPSEESLTEVANWWVKWFTKAGHKRLGKILLQYKSKGAKSG